MKKEKTKKKKNKKDKYKNLDFVCTNFRNLHIWDSSEKKFY